VIIKLKIYRQGLLLKKYKSLPFLEKSYPKKTIQDLFLIEARAAKYFWSKFNTLLPKAYFDGRKPHSGEIANQLLDIGYHHLAGKVKKILVKYNIPTELALLHKASSMKSEPLVYDLMEMFRADVVDAEVLRFLRSKKKIIKEVSGKVIPIFLNRINKRCERLYYLKVFETCRSYSYYMELQNLRFIKAINSKEVFKPIDLPNRHENRCANKNLTADKQNANNDSGIGP
jgi:CRISPR-associated endonuclease Cas1